MTVKMPPSLSSKMLPSLTEKTVPSLTSKKVPTPKKRWSLKAKVLQIHLTPAHVEEKDRGDKSYLTPILSPVVKAEQASPHPHLLRR